MSVRHNRVVTDPQFRADLYQGAGRDYDQYRLAYPQPLIDDLLRRSGANGNGRLLDLACGTGQLSFAMRSTFAETWAVDQEPDMIAVVEEKARAAGLTDLRTEICAAEDLSAPEASFDLVVIGNAFHRMRRDDVAARVLRWLSPGGFLALVWGGSPWEGDASWQQELAAIMRRWRSRVESGAEAVERVPTGYEQARQARPDMTILESLGFELAGSFSFEVTHHWTPDEIVGFAYSTSVLSRRAVGDLGPEFEEDLRRELDAYVQAGGLRQAIEFAYRLACRPLAGAQPLNTWL